MTQDYGSRTPRGDDLINQQQTGPSVISGVGDYCSDVIVLEKNAMTILFLVSLQRQYQNQTYLSTI